MVLAGMGADAPQRGREGIDVGDDAPGLRVGFLGAQPDLVALCDGADPAADVTAVGAATLARRRFLDLLRPISRCDPFLVLRRSLRVWLDGHKRVSP